MGSLVRPDLSISLFEFLDLFLLLFRELAVHTCGGPPAPADRLWRETQAIAVRAVNGR